VLLTRFHAHCGNAPFGAVQIELHRPAWITDGGMMALLHGRARAAQGAGRIAFGAARGYGVAKHWLQFRCAR
jgi:hypothetical protein